MLLYKLNLASDLPHIHTFDYQLLNQKNVWKVLETENDFQHIPTQSTPFPHHNTLIFSILTMCGCVGNQKRLFLKSNFSFFHAFLLKYCKTVR